MQEYLATQPAFRRAEDDETTSLRNLLAARRARGGSEDGKMVLANIRQKLFQNSK